ncbi:TspO/MBR family protein [Leucobacter massiliensis]|uniref:TspO protein n=1 Tax=Leucobacter massiliensis TaxID=1686285 RepID=A0A2S9QM38_9MICO|nr:TspO/MBR family protein [Leucobacter massiliensis]PRI10647.1 TspO protein [Leucobacter massiliensis]
MASTHTGAGTRPAEWRRTDADAGPSRPRQLLAALAFLLIVALIAVLGSLASASNVDGWYAEAEKVPWDPPNVVFGPVWTVLYALIALAGWLIWRAGFAAGRPNRARRALGIFVAQLVLNSLWTPVFFAGFPLFGEAAWWIALAIIVALAITVVWLAAAAAPWSKVAAGIMVPYLLWLLFATSLNIGIIALN